MAQRRECKVSRAAADTLHQAAESYMTNVFLKCQIVVGHAKRKTVKEQDLQVLEALKRV